jgi:hypothetical protein
MRQESRVGGIELIEDVKGLFSGIRRESFDMLANRRKNSFAASYRTKFELKHAKRLYIGNN